MGKIRFTITMSIDGYAAGPGQGGASENGEGGIRTLEAGLSPPNALAGRRLQPLGHFSGAAHGIAVPRPKIPLQGHARHRWSLHSATAGSP